MRLDNKTDDYKATRKNVYMSIGVMHFQEKLRLRLHCDHFEIGHSDWLLHKSSITPWILTQWWSLNQLILLMKVFLQNRPELIKYLQKIAKFLFFLVNFAAAILDSIVNIILDYLKILERTLKCKIKRQNRVCEITTMLTILNDVF